MYLHYVKANGIILNVKLYVYLVNITLGIYKDATDSYESMLFVYICTNYGSRNF